MERGWLLKLQTTCPGQHWVRCVNSYFVLSALQVGPLDARLIKTFHVFIAADPLPRNVLSLKQWQPIGS